MRLSPSALWFLSIPTRLWAFSLQQGEPGQKRAGAPGLGEQSSLCINEHWLGASSAAIDCSGTWPCPAQHPWWTTVRIWSGSGAELGFSSMRSPVLLWVESCFSVPCLDSQGLMLMGFCLRCRGFPTTMLIFSPGLFLRWGWHTFLRKPLFPVSPDSGCFLIVGFQSFRNMLTWNKVPVHQENGATRQTLPQTC